MSMKPGDIVLVTVHEDDSKSRASIVKIEGKVSTVKLEEGGDIVEVLTDSLEAAPMRVDFIDLAPSPKVKKSLDELKESKQKMIQSLGVPKERKPQRKPKRTKFKKHSNSGNGQPTEDQLQRLMNKFNKDG